MPFYVSKLLRHRARILVQVTIYCRLMIGRDGNDSIFRRMQFMSGTTYDVYTVRIRPDTTCNSLYSMGDFGEMYLM